MRDKPESEFVPIVANNEQVYDAYPELFDKINISNSNIYLEKSNLRKDESFVKNESYIKEDRILLLPSGMISITTLDLDHLWDMNERDEKLLGEFNLYTEELNRKRINKEEIRYFQEKEINGRQYGIKYYPYNDIHNNKVMVDMLEKKLLALRGIPSR